MGEEIIEKRKKKRVSLSGKKIPILQEKLLRRGEKSSRSRSEREEDKKHVSL